MANPWFTEPPKEVIVVAKEEKTPIYSDVVRKHMEKKVKNKKKKEGGK